MKSNFIAALLILFPLISCTQQAKTPTGTFVKDFNLYQKALEEAHPGLYRYHTKKQFDSLFQATRQSLNDADDLISFFAKLASITSFIGCGHTATLMPQNWSRRDEINKKHLPFEFRVVNGKAMVYKSYIDDPDYAPGTELVSIGKPFSELAQQILPLLTADGVVQSSKWRDLERNFSFFLQMLANNEGRYKTVLRKANGDIISKEIDLIDVTTLPQPTKRPQLEFNILKDDNSAIMTIRSFSSDIRDADGNGFPEFLSQCFRSIKDHKIKNLIIDVRNNGGGRDEYGSLLFSYLTDEPYAYYHYLEVNKPEYSFLSYTNTSESFLQRLASTTHQTADGRYLLNTNQHPCLSEQQPSTPAFHGSVFVLINGRSFSATAEFCAVTRFHNRAIFLGEETSGGYEGNNSGGNILLTLPESKIRLAIPTYKYVSAVDIQAAPKGRGIIPDHEVQPTVMGLAEEKDEVMDFTLDLISNLTNNN